MIKLKNMHILLIDDDIELCELLNDWLKQDGYKISCAHNAKTALTYLGDSIYDLIILDVMLPDMSGLELLKMIREIHARIPILMLSARGEPLDKTLGLELGADDYLAKPCEPRELSARIRTILRRTSPTATNVIQLDDLQFDLSQGLVYIDNKVISLTISEAQILAILLAQPNIIVDKQELSIKALGRKLAAFDRSLDMHISNLRKKLGIKKDGNTRIMASRGRGYYYNL